MPINPKSILGQSPEELRRQYSPTQLRSMLAEIERPANSLTPTAEDGGVGFVNRAIASLATSPEGQANILRERGFDVVNLADGRLGVRQGQTVRPVDPKGFDVGDVADFAGDLPAGILSSLGGLAGLTTGPGALGFAAAGGMAGDVVRQGLSNLAGSKAGYKPTQTATEGILAPIGELGGRLAAAGLKKAVAPFKKATETGRILKATVGPAQEMDIKFGTALDETMPISARSESPLVGMLDQRTREGFATADKAQIADDAFQEQVQGAVRGIRQQGNIPKSNEAEDVGDLLFGAAQKTADLREKQVNQAFDELGDLLAPNAPIVPTNTQAALFESMKRSGALELPDDNLTGGVVEQFARLAEDLEGKETFAQLDAWRRALGNKLKARDSVFNREGMDAHISRIYAGLKQDLDGFFEQGGRLTAEQQAIVNARQGAKEAAARGETITARQAIKNLGGMDTRGLGREGVAPKVARAIKTIETQARKGGGVPEPPENIAQRLAEDYPELGITDRRSLLEALRREDYFFDPVERNTDEGMDALFAGRQPETQPFDVDDFEFRLNNAETLDDVMGAMDSIARSAEGQYISPFDARRLKNTGLQKMIDLSGGAVEGERETLEAAAAQFEDQLVSLGRDLSEKGARATRLAKEEFDLQRSSASRLFNDPDRSESLVARLSRQDVGVIRRAKQIAGVTGTEGGLQATEGATDVWRQAQARILDDILDGATNNIHGGREVLSGAKMFTALDKLGKRKVGEIFGQETADNLLTFARFLRDSNAAERTFANTSKTASANGFFQFLGQLAKNPTSATGALLINKLAGQLPLTDRGRRLLTTGLMQSPKQQNILSTLGRVPVQTGLSSRNRE